MVDLARRGSILEQMRSHFTSQGWPETDLSRFLMQEGEGAGGDEGDTEDEEQKDRKSAGDDDVEAMKRALKKANREAEQFRLKVKEFEDASKSEQEKLAESLREQEQRAETAALSALRFEIALDKGIPKTIANRLQGSTREEMEADADELLKTLGNGRRTPSFDGGAKDDEAPAGGSFLAKALRDRRSA